MTSVDCECRPLQVDSLFRISHTDPWVRGDSHRTSRTINFQARHCHHALLAATAYPPHLLGGAADRFWCMCWRVRFLKPRPLPATADAACACPLCQALTALTLPFSLTRLCSQNSHLYSETSCTNRPQCIFYYFSAFCEATLTQYANLYTRKEHCFWLWMIRSRIICSTSPVRFRTTHRHWQKSGYPNAALVCSLCTQREGRDWPSNNAIRKSMCFDSRWSSKHGNWVNELPVTWWLTCMYAF